ncbi:hypothetical protein QJQ45_003993 [Haematococcus lacustris]|nr:hypothetical protein QJQ45_003993 [Haematococcus lacustris]
MATRSRIRGLMCSTSNGIRFYDRDVSAALNIARIAAGPGRPRELSSWLGRPAMPNPGRPGQEWVQVVELAEQQQAARRSAPPAPLAPSSSWGLASGPLSGHGGGAAGRRRAGGGLARLHRSWLRQWHHLRALLWREGNAMTRNPADVAGRLITFSWLAVLIVSGAPPDWLIPPSTPAATRSQTDSCLPPRPIRITRGLAPLACITRGLAPLACITRGRPAQKGQREGGFLVGLGLVFFNLGTSPEGLRNRLNLLAWNTLFYLLIPFINMGLYTSDRRYFLADMASGLYKPSLYYMAKVSVALPCYLLAALSYALITYGLAGLRHDPLSVLHSATLQCTLGLIAAQVLHFSAVLAPNQDMAFMIAIIWTAVNVMTSNFFILLSQMELRWLSHLRWLSAMNYGFGGLALEELRHALYDCSQARGGVQLLGPEGSGHAGIAPDLALRLPQLLPTLTGVAKTLFNVAQSQLTIPQEGCVIAGDAALQFFDITRPFRLTFGILLSYLAILHGLTFAALLLVAHNERR